jgi:agmatine deiminase
MERGGQREAAPATSAPTAAPSLQPTWGDEQHHQGTCRPPNKRVAHWWLLAGAAVLTCWVLVLTRRGVERLQTASHDSIEGVVPGEFEPCQGLLLAPPEAERSFNVFVEIIAQAHDRVPVCLLTRDGLHQSVLEERLRQAGLAGRVRFLRAPFANPWVRDYGPVFIKSFRGGYELLDLDYAQNRHSPSMERHIDDGVPPALAARLGKRAVRVPIVLDGGNLLSNGAGLCLATSRLRDVNADQSWETLRRTLRERLGARDFVVLEPLAREATGHVDMFCTFTAPDTVLVASCDEKADPENAAILDRNAQRLACLKTPCGPLQVVRLPTPASREDFRWMSYTNVVYVNRLLLVPSYPEAAPGVEEDVLRTYRRLLPGWDVRKIDAGPLLDTKGSLHCASAQLYGI